MKPFEIYDFQKIKNVYESESESVSKWIEPALKGGATLHLIPFEKGTRAALHKKGADFYLQVDGRDGNLAKDYSSICDDFSFYQTDFVLEGFIKQDDTFVLTDALYVDSDLTNDVLSKRIEILNKQFGDLNGYSTSIRPSYVVETLDEYNEFKKTHSGSYYAGVDSSLYTAGCSSSQWCSVGKRLKKPVTKTKSLYSMQDWELWKSKLIPGVRGRFELFKNESSFEIAFQPLQPNKSNIQIGIAFDEVDKSIQLKRQFEKGNQFIVGFKKSKSPNPSELVDHGSFQILKSTDQSTSLELDGLNHVLQGIFHVDGISKHNTEISDQVPTDHVYYLSYPDSNIPVDEDFGKIQWKTEKTTSISKALVAKAEKEEDEEERFVFGEVLVPEDVDAHGDIYNAKEVRYAAHFFMEYFNNVGYMHEEFINNGAKIIESYVAPVAMTIEGRKIKKGTWLIGMRIKDDVLWSDIKLEKLTGFSIGGVASVQALKNIIKEYEGV